MSTPALHTALSTTRAAWLSGDPNAWALYRTCCARLSKPAPTTGARAHRATKAKPSPARGG